MRRLFIQNFFLLLFLPGFLVLTSIPVTAQKKVILSDEAEISLLICGPSHDASFTLYGHAAIRIHDPGQTIDIIFNYGIFDFSVANFIYRFAKGETDYKLGATDFFNYMIEYQMRGSSVNELVLNLTNNEKNRIWDALLINYLPQNRVYRYNFFFDNCATRLVTLVEQNINGKVVYDTRQPEQTFRDLINYCTREHNWLTFGCDLALGSPTDRIATPHEKMFLPEQLESAFRTAQIKENTGHTRALLKKVIPLAPFDPEINNYPSEKITPNLAFWVLFTLILFTTVWEFRKKKYVKLLDSVLFSIAGIAGCVLFFISCLSIHPSVFPNWSLVWLHPLHLVGAVLITVKKFQKAANCYHFINFVALTFLLVGWYFLPQHMNRAFIPLILILWTRSAFTVYRSKKGKE